LTHITEHPASGRVLTELIGQDATPQVLVRIGLAPSIEDVPPPTPRRPLNEVLEFRPSTN
ncbi:MAG: NAD(P)H nitroreductase, partial [Actinomycetota bacterium]|nr:NAD(P)H nitroreductase [Actinomycetota bacterium]